MGAHSTAPKRVHLWKETSRSSEARKIPVFSPPSPLFCQQQKTHFREQDKDVRTGWLDESRTWVNRILPSLHRVTQRLRYSFGFPTCLPMQARLHDRDGRTGWHTMALSVDLLYQCQRVSSEGWNDPTSGSVNAPLRKELLILTIISKSEICPLRYELHCIFASVRAPLDLFQIFTGLKST